MYTLFLIIISVVATGICAILLVIAFGGPAKLPQVQSGSNPFESVDFSDLPAIYRFKARDGTQLAYRSYFPSSGESRGNVIIIHGSSSRSDSVHPLAKGFSQANYTTYALDIRGHGESIPKGKIAYLGQLEDDIEDFLLHIKSVGIKTLVGFSAGGGFALRFAASSRQKLFDNYLLLAPFLSQDSPTYRPGGGGWASVGVPRIIGLSILNRFGITVFNNLPVTSFALSQEAQKFLTPKYSFALAANFRPNLDYRSNIRDANQPMEVLVGQDDDQFFAEQFSTEFNELGKQVSVIIIPKTDHINLILKPAAIQTAIACVRRLSMKAKSDLLE
jgi:non-heme chloroperoxidase